MFDWKYLKLEVVVFFALTDDMYTRFVHQSTQVPLLEIMLRFKLIKYEKYNKISMK